MKKIMLYFANSKKVLPSIKIIQYNILFNLYLCAKIRVSE
ncbi:hypothetical protein HMPREF9151_02273 [Hoylesella saccharolytica F0055]|uniref:Uncharacterized protein n=1 Tax=Hoylesella saccharolytica F0055 TaxID=1127699 RepID=L1N158_9BACT|nr:hypothetical protein HMPREF9151_02273 [Hoylesella saccharolytica F0055]